MRPAASRAKWMYGGACRTVGNASAAPDRTPSSAASRGSVAALIRDLIAPRDPDSRGRERPAGAQESRAACPSARAGRRTRHGATPRARRRRPAPRAKRPDDVIHERRVPFDQLEHRPSADRAERLGAVPSEPRPASRRRNDQEARHASGPDRVGMAGEQFAPVPEKDRHGQEERPALVEGHADERQKGCRVDVGPQPGREDQILKYRQSGNRPDQAPCGRAEVPAGGHDVGDERKQQGEIVSPDGP